MLRGIFALFFRSLRGDSRSIWVHASWFFLLLIIYFALTTTQLESWMISAPGLTFFKYVVFCDAVFLTLLGISYFSNVITEEKEEDTLGLMTMAGINTLGILLGKSTTRLFQVCVLLALQYPFTLLAITLGGLGREQVYSAYAALLSYTVLLANVGLFSSVLCRRNRTAAVLTTLLMAVYIFAPLIAVISWETIQWQISQQDPYWMQVGPWWLSVMSWVWEANVFYQLTMALETNHEFAWTPQLTSNALAGLAMFLLSWWLFGLVAHDSSAETTGRSVPKRTGRLRWFSAGRTWNNALAWKDFHFVAGGSFMTLTRCLLYSGLYWLVVLAAQPGDQVLLAAINWRDVTWAYEGFVVPLFVLDCGLCIGRVFQEEIRQQTLASLLMLPIEVNQLVYSKIRGCLLGLFPGIVAVFSAFFLFQGALESTVKMLAEPFAWWFVANLFLIIHLSALLSLYLRWGTFVIALAITLGSMFVTGMIMTSMFFFGGNSDSGFVIGFFAFLVFSCCGLCHLAILRRMPVLGER